MDRCPFFPLHALSLTLKPSLFLSSLSQYDISIILDKDGLSTDR